MKKLQMNFSWGVTFRLLAIASINLLVLAACQRPAPDGEPMLFSTEIPNSALFAEDTLGLRGSVGLRTSAPSRRGVTAEETATTTSAGEPDVHCLALIPQCMNRRPHSMFVYLANVIRTYYPQWNSFTYVRFGYGTALTSPSIPACSKGKWNIKVSGNTSGFEIVPVRYFNSGATKVNVNNRRSLDFDAETRGLAGIMLAFKHNQNNDCRYYTQDASYSWTSNWYWRPPVCNTFAAPMITISGTFEPDTRIDGIRTTELRVPACDAKTTFSQTLQFSTNTMNYYSSEQAEGNEIYGWTLKYENQNYYPFAWE